MENIRQALERARALNAGGADWQVHAAPPRQIFDSNVGIQPSAEVPDVEIVLRLAHLESNRIIAHDDADPRSKSFDMLRTQVLQAMDQKKWRILGVTSATPDCGKTVTAINLAFSIARQPDRSVLLVDLDLRKPRVASCLGVNCRSGVVSVLEGQTSLSNVIFQARAANCHVAVLPAEGEASNTSAWMVSQSMSSMLQEIKRDYRSHLVVVDLPPMLSSDDVIAVLPQLDCILFVAAAGKSTTREIEECNKHLQTAQVVRLVLNKAQEPTAQYYGYYSPPRPRPARPRRRKGRIGLVAGIIGVLLLAGAFGVFFGPSINLSWVDRNWIDQIKSLSDRISDELKSLKQSVGGSVAFEQERKN
jgi:protein-tyrosine kinase